MATTAHKTIIFNNKKKYGNKKTGGIYVSNEHLRNYFVIICEKQA